MAGSEPLPPPRRQRPSPTSRLTAYQHSTASHSGHYSYYGYNGRYSYKGNNGYYGKNV